MIALILLAIVGAAILGHQLGSAPVTTGAAPLRHLAIDNPYAAGGFWYRGNLHVASVRGLGRDLPSTIGRWYADHGYGFVGISDANTYTWPSEFGSRTVTGVPVVAASYSFADVLAVGTDHWLPASNLQQAVDWIAQDGGLPVLAAPLSSSKPQSVASVIGVHRLFGLEVYNARLATAGPGQGDATSFWDRLLSAGNRVYAFAGDDAMGVSDPAIGRAWVDVLAPSPDPDSLLGSLRQGAFTASTGAGFTAFSVDGTTITAEAAEGSSLRFIGRGGRLLKAVSSAVASYRANGDEGYVRVEAIRDDGARAWSQPFFLSWR